MVKTDNSLGDFSDTQTIGCYFNSIRCLAQGCQSAGAVADVALLNIPF
jgi:hypothetical protein